MTQPYGEVPISNQQQTQQQQALAQQQYDQQVMMEDYYYRGDTFRGMQPTDQAAQVRQAIFNCELPNQDADFGQWIPMLVTAVDMVARIPGIDHNVVRELNLRMDIIVDRAHSQGRKRQVAAKMQKLIFRLRSLVAMGDTPLAGMTGITAMVTTNQNQKQEIRMPQQQTQPGGFWPWSRK